MIDLRVIIRAAAGMTALLCLLTTAACNQAAEDTAPAVMSTPSAAESASPSTASAAQKQESKQQSKQQSTVSAADKEQQQTAAFQNLSYWTKTDTGIKIFAKASVEDKAMQYAFFFRRTTNKKWNTIGTPYSSRSTASLTLKDGVKYEIKVQIKNSSGHVEPVSFEVDNTIPLLENRTKIKYDIVETGSSTKITAKAAGGVEPYTYAFYFKRASNQRWNKLGTEFDVKNSAKFKPSSADRYQLRIIVRDHSGQAAIKEMYITSI